MIRDKVGFSPKFGKDSHGKKKAAKKKKKSSAMDTVREIAQTIFPRKERQARRNKAPHCR